MINYHRLEVLPRNFKCVHTINLGSKHLRPLTAAARARVIDRDLLQDLAQEVRRYLLPAVEFSYKLNHTLSGSDLLATPRSAVEVGADTTINTLERSSKCGLAEPGIDLPFNVLPRVLSSTLRAAPSRPCTGT